MHGADGNTDLPCQIAAIDGVLDIAGQDRLDVPEDLELRGRVRT